ncbi:MAG: ferrous iron transport protein B [Bacteroidia bacterium]|nr:ferrous iron transport protein B [Bacteroidia bacterium]
MTLAELQTGQKGIITKVKGRGVFRRRIMDMGFIHGKEVTVIKSAPLQNPIEYQILGCYVSLRRSEAELIVIVPASTETSLAGSIVTPAEAPSRYTKAGTGAPDLSAVVSERVPAFAGMAEKGVVVSGVVPVFGTIEVALVGNPNCGKTSIFNLASHSREHTGNYPGVTVDSKIAELQLDNHTFQLTDLPGTYSLSTYSPDELFVRDQLLLEHPDVVINVIDASNIERNLYLTSQLIDMDIPVVIALNMYDELEQKGDKLDHELLGKMLGIPVVPTVGIKGTGIDQLFRKVVEVVEGRDKITRHIHIPYDREIEISIKRIQNKIWDSPGFSDRFSSRFLAIKLLEHNPEVMKSVDGITATEEHTELANREIARIENFYKQDVESLLTSSRYGFITGALRETFKKKVSAEELKTAASRIDDILTHKWLGFPIFLLFLWIMFQSTFNLGKYPVHGIEAAVHALSGWLHLVLPTGILRDLLIDGIIGGVGGVIIFLPNILILFFFISFMEDTGYMARVAFIMDKLMHLIGLHGKSFIPLIMGFGCNVPAIMATRTIENRSDRLMTMLIVPLMSCSARLTVYILIAGVIFPRQAANVIFGLYLVGIVLSILMALIFRNTLFRNKEAPFVMELPPYRRPRTNAIVKHMWFRSRLYLKKMGGVILIASMIIWALGYFPRTSENKTVQLENSAIGHIGHAVQPVLAPLGFDWKMSVAVLSGIAAKEVVVSTIGVLYQDGDTGTSLQVRMMKSKHAEGRLKGQDVFTLRAGLAFMLFVLIYVPCIAVLAAIRRESGKWKWSALMVGYMTFLAWIVARLGYFVTGLF